jgi:site-specific recombinase XerD
MLIRVSVSNEASHKGAKMDTSAMTVAKQNAGSPDLEPLIRMVTDTVSARSQRDYRRALVDFLTWYAQTGQTELNKATVQRYASELRDAGKSAANINQRLSAIRKLAAEAADNGVLDPHVAAGVQRAKGARAEGNNLGNWLTKEQAEALIGAPSVATLKGKRDRALLAVLIGTGVRRVEGASLTVEHIQERDGRWVIVDLVGKRNKTRSVPLPAFAKALVDRWLKAAGITSGRIFRPVNKGDHLAGEGMTPQSIYIAIVGYAKALGMDIAAHDTRRTFAKLADRGGAALAQISLTLGHESLATTQRYLGLEQDLVDAPCDHLGLHIEMNGK